MALDKQKILNELGSVVNQLQSADCGCMGKLFSNQSAGQGGAMANPQAMGGYGRGFGRCMHGGCCCGHGGNHGHAPGAGVPVASNTNGPCMGRCNPRKVYTDTYSYLNQNLMQPAVNEVYNDLKSISPQNTIMNNAMAGNMGLSPQGGNPMQGRNAMQGGNHMQGGNLMQGDFKQGGNLMHGGHPMQGETHTQGGNPMEGGHPMLRGHPMQGGNPMKGGDLIQGGDPMHGLHRVQVGYSMQDGTPMQGDMGMQHNKMMGSYIGNQMQDNMNLPQNQMQSGDMSYQVLGTKVQDTTGMLSHQMQGNTGMPNNQIQGRYIGNQGIPMNQMVNQKMAHMMGGMGPQIVNMMKQNSTGKPFESEPKEGQMPGTMLIDAPQSPHGTVGVTSLNNAGGMNPGQHNADAGMINNTNQQMYNTTQYMSNPNMTSGFNPNAQKNNTINANMPQIQGNAGAIPAGNNNSNPTAQQIGSRNRNYGQHNQGMTKFNEMFPGVMQGMGGELGFDPMAIAIQMNPANQKKAAMDAMQKMLFGNSAHMQNAEAGANTAAATIAQGNAATTSQQNIPPSNQQPLNGQPGSAAAPMTQNRQYGGNISATMTPAQPNQVPPQQVYDTNKVTGAPTMNQGQPPQQMEAQQQQQQQYQQQIDPNTGAPMQQTFPSGNQGATGDNAQMQQQPASDTSPEMGQLMIQDPIYPVDNSRFHPSPSMRRTKYYQYNTLGQHVEMLPAKLYNSLPETSLPQTLSPEPWNGKLRKDIARFNVKSTMSKTSLMANKPVGKTPSRAQLQNIYNQYKGSNSYTKQNVRAPDNGASFSEGKLGIAQRGNENQGRPVPVERVGGDTTANNQGIFNQVAVKGQPEQYIGDVHASNKPHGDVIPTEDPPMMQGKLRNGLQDMTYTSYPTSAAWSFHGDAYKQGHFSFNRRFRNRA